MGNDLKNQDGWPHLFLILMMVLAIFSHLDFVSVEGWVKSVCIAGVVFVYRKNYISAHKGKAFPDGVAMFFVVYLAALSLHLTDMF